jgi:hypothetical protein
MLSVAWLRCMTLWKHAEISYCTIIKMMHSFMLHRLHGSTRRKRNCGWLVIFRLAAPRIPAAGIMGVLHEANPQDACTPLIRDPDSERSLLPPFVVVARGICNFDTKVRHAQEAGFGAVIVYNNADNHELVTSKSTLLFLFCRVQASCFQHTCLLFWECGFGHLTCAFYSWKVLKHSCQLVSRHCCMNSPLQSLHVPPISNFCLTGKLWDECHRQDLQTAVLSVQGCWQAVCKVLTVPLKISQNERNLNRGIILPSQYDVE